MVLLVVHGCAGVLWFTPVQVLPMTSSAGRSDERGPAQRHRALSRRAGWAGGGGFILLALDHPTASFSIRSSQAALLWLVNAPYGPRSRRRAAAARAVRGLADITHTVRAIRIIPSCVDDDPGRGCVVLCQQRLQPQMPGFAEDPAMAPSYSMPLRADACGAFLAGVSACSGGYCRRGSAPPSCSPTLVRPRWPAFFVVEHPLALGPLLPPGFRAVVHDGDAWCRSTHR
jgi:hypothetical protein